MVDESVLNELETSFIQLHEAQLKSSRVPEIYWKSLFKKLREEKFDAGEYFQICMRVDEDDEVIGYKAICTAENGLNKDDPNGVFLIDHAWTYRLNEARAALAENENLLNRMVALMNIKPANLEDDEKANEAKSITERKINAVMKAMWKHNQTYKLSTEKLSDDERESIWYIMDEFGSSIRHSDEPSVECMPFFYIPNATMYSLIWPIRSLNKGDELTRDYVYGIKDEVIRRAKLLPWNEDDDLEDEADDDPRVQPEPDVNYFMSGTKDEILPESDEIREVNLSRRADPIKVYTDLSGVRDNLTDKKYCFVDDISQADIIFVRKHHKDYKSLREKSPNVLINQFPFENVVTVKDLLAIVCRRASDSSNWLPITYNLSYELIKFIRYFKEREDDGLDNYWILKPWNLARSIDMTITNDLNQIIRWQETGPKIACKYITNPVLFYREELNGKVKFDIRYIILLRSIKPLKIYTYKVFWLRFANKPYSLDNFEDYEKHFTVMNYKPSAVLKQINCDEFVSMFEKQNPAFKWLDIETKIFKMIRAVFDSASKEEPPRGMAANYQSRAMYAIDLMLDWRRHDQIEPMICEINFMPDCTRACKYHSNFFNHVFDALFLDKLDYSSVTPI